MMRRPPRSTLFPYTTLFRSVLVLALSPEDGGPTTGARGRLRNLLGKPGDVVLEVATLSLGAITAVALTHNPWLDRKSTRLNSSHANISYAVFCLKKKKKSIF